MLAENVGAMLHGCEWVGVPFAGGMSELVHIKARTLAVNDLHRHVINLARVVADPSMGPLLIRRLRRLPFHPDMLKSAQARCDNWDWTQDPWSTEAAEAYFVCAWMGRSGEAGTGREFNGKTAMRWEAGGGDSCVRFRSAIEGLRDWRKILVRATFTTMDVFDFLDKCKDRKGHGIYCDPPFPGPGDAYKHKFTLAQHSNLRDKLTSYNQTRIVCRFYDAPLIRDLYIPECWTWHHLQGRKQTNDAAPEVLLLRN